MTKQKVNNLSLYKDAVSNGELNMPALDKMTMRLTQARAVLVSLEVNRDGECILAPEIIADCVSAARELIEQAQLAARALRS